ncbi:DUF6460 domain-containing protein [Blastochloris viridis]|uniref:DUF6460 domain-containing protein n=1 Tax=Blastochloris viridis TaxID=1079 RepID=A0A0H5BDM6_BLAVI|nr:DUF6460 domain-containing protein [Blastochloris viridis]ALK10841.1 hypothetical protein BVIR_3081 [Blastochloris viridis]BAR99184.1 hypothetical protein BV133_1591 [Blastochloris viridis]CUU43503.1 hypothetical protein BVIRIDIS_25250 [Blastochloris viridis]
MTNPDPASPPPDWREPSAVDRFFGGPPVWVALRLLMLSLVVGVILSVIGLDPFNIIQSLVDFVRWIIHRIENVFHLGFDTVEWIVRYVLLGAAVVVPIWLIVRFAKMNER